MTQRLGHQLLALVGGSLLTLFLPSCAPPTVITAGNVDNLVVSFQSGSTDLDEPFFDSTPDRAKQLHALADAMNWTSLSKLVIQTNVGDDIEYYYLGLSAENLGYRQAALIYYKKSDFAYHRLCDPSFIEYAASLCYGIQLPRDADNRTFVLSPNGQGQ